MALLRAQLVGSGTPGDPFRIPLPNYEMVADNGSAAPGTVHVTQTRSAALPAMSALVRVPDSDLPDGFGDSRCDGVAQLAGMDVITAVCPDHRDALHALLDARYAEHAGRFRPQVV
jgi:hypothetical protein